MPTSTPDPTRSKELDDLKAEILDLPSDPGCDYAPTGILHAGEPRQCEAPSAWVLNSSCGDAALFCVEHGEHMQRRLFGFERSLFCTTHKIRVAIEWRRKP